MNRLDFINVKISALKLISKQYYFILYVEGCQIFLIFKFNYIFSFYFVARDIFSFAQRKGAAFYLSPLQILASQKHDHIQSPSLTTNSSHSLTQTP